MNSSKKICLRNSIKKEKIMLNLKDGVLRIGGKEMKDLGWIYSPNNARELANVTEIRFFGIREIVSFPFEKFCNLRTVMTGKDTEVFDFNLLAKCERLREIDVKGGKNASDFNVNLKIVGQLPPNVAEKLAIPSWLDVLRYRPDFFFAIPKRRFQDQRFVKYCLDRGVWGMKKRGELVEDYVNSEQRKDDVVLYRKMRQRIKEELGVEMVGEVKNYSQVQAIPEKLATR